MPRRREQYALRGRIRLIVLQRKLAACGTVVISHLQGWNGDMALILSSPSGGEQGTSG